MQMVKAKNLTIDSDYKLLVEHSDGNLLQQNKGKKIRKYPLTSDKEKGWKRNMASDAAPLLDSQDSNFDEDDYLSERNRKNYGLQQGNGKGKKKENSCCGKFMWCLCGGCFQIFGRYQVFFFFQIRLVLQKKYIVRRGLSYLLVLKSYHTSSSPRI